jgi:putative methionine-R-sulfoxide reductase with GAF domain
MSIKTDLASIEIIADVYQSQDLRKTFADLVHTLHNQVSYFDWVGLYLHQGEDLVLEASSNIEDDLAWESNSELRIPIEDSLEQELGKIVVRSRQPICFDITDVSTLKTLASEISRRLALN